MCPMASEVSGRTRRSTVTAFFVFGLAVAEVLAAVIGAQVVGLSFTDATNSPRASHQDSDQSRLDVVREATGQGTRRGRPAGSTGWSWTSRSLGAARA